MAVTLGTNLAMGGGTITGLGASTTESDSIRFEQNKVVQTVQSTTTLGVTTTSASYVDTGLSVTITPTSSSNNILIIAQTTAQANGGSNGTKLTILRGAVNLSAVNGFALTNSSSNPQPCLCWMATYLDSPATVSATTYKVQFKGNGNTAFFGKGAGTSTAGICTMIAIEVRP